LICLSGEPDHDYDQLFSGLKRPAVYMLNEAKNRSAWGVYFPFTLSIREPQNLLAFLEGNVYVLVVLDRDAMCAVAKKHGITLTFNQNEGDDWCCDVSWDLAQPGEPMTARMSQHLVDRIACELLSWDWLMSEQREQFLNWRELFGADENGRVI
jgi:hypothetical protein